MAYADVSDLIARRSPKLPPLTQEEEAYAGVLLDDASAYLDQLMQITPADVEPGSALAENLKVVCCNIVTRVMNAQETDNISSISQTIGSASGSIHYAIPEASMYLTKSDRVRLGLSKGKYQSIRPEGAW